MFDSISGHHLHASPVGKTSGHLPSLIPFSRQQADTAVINEEEVTCQWPHFSHFVSNVIHVNDSAGSRCPPLPSLPLSLHIVHFCAVGLAEEPNKQGEYQTTDVITPHRPDLNGNSDLTRWLLD